MRDALSDKRNRADDDIDRMIQEVCHAAVGDNRADMMHDAMRSCIARCESPIEKALLCSMVYQVCNLPGHSEPGLVFVYAPSAWPYPGIAGQEYVALPDCIPATVDYRQAWNGGDAGCVIREGHREHYVIHQQEQYPGMRVDFSVTHIELVTTRDMAHKSFSSRVLVECDGHDFHERTKAQAKRDRKRDRALQQNGEKVFRFTGSEIWEDPIGCAWEVILNVSTDTYEQSRAWRAEHDADYIRRMRREQEPVS